MSPSRIRAHRLGGMPSIMPAMLDEVATPPTTSLKPRRFPVAAAPYPAPARTSSSSALAPGQSRYGGIWHPPRSECFQCFSLQIPFLPMN